jgi:hypothetical protein
MIRSMPTAPAAPMSCLIALAASAALVQSPTPAPPSPPAAAAPVAGQIPPDASADARARWEALVKAARGDTTGAIRAFDLQFELRVYSGEKQSNDGGVTRYKYLEPDCVSMEMASGRKRMRGRSGDFLIDKSGVYPLEGRDYKEDQRELAESLSVARLFAGLTDPSRVRLASLGLLSAPPPGLPESLAKTAAGLDWLVLTSPDFLARAAGTRETLDRVEIGLDRSTHLPALALVADPARPESAVLAQLSDYRLLDGYRVPGEVTTWRVAPPAQGAPTRPVEDRLPFSARAAVKLWLMDGSLRAKLEPKDFAPE